MADRRQPMRTGKAKPLFFEIVSTVASLIFMVTGVLVLETSPTGEELGSFLAILMSVFGLYGTVLGVLALLDLAYPPASPQASTR